ncbi:acyl-CoA-dependent ceramide synthase [Aureobasidium pullulans]|nr:acyl-CoA-dependent ceramide synthase [Aureobasidium pullulans]THV79534.1 acyl-CoA-dependent ceramide synthase [Aureobasidium pullulans]THW09422.1 acyl-CoA-dependent ceramide synthase [Aureobasidium pullulans]THX21577.1 acyl-CoA-dependent ceramide synthase [Aureobasidium pullulans]THX24704.1 acyl-CoA-dependent ceramide synthase [Aureobasidium pullulans]
MADNKMEPFPPLSPPKGAFDKHGGPPVTMSKPRPRRKSSSLGGEPRGDTGVGALATLTSLPQRTPTPTQEKPTRTSKRRKARSLLKRYVRVSLRHTWLNPLILMLLVLGLYAVNPSTSNPFYNCIFLAYPLDTPAGEPTQYGKGKADFAFVAFYTIVLSFTREFLMQRMIRPLAIRLGIQRKAKQARFMEQFYTAIYFAIFGPFGLYVMRRSPVWYFNTTAMFEGFPHRSHEAVFKAYYLLQASYWAQQAIVLLLMLEKPRKDFKELVLHHVVTLALIWLSYRFHFTYMGIAVYITMDISDFFLATSKVLNYLNSPVTGPYFGLFIGVWFYLRHYLNLHILWAVLTTFRTVGPFELNWETQQYKCWISQIITFSLLFALQAVNVFWFVLILRIAWRFVRSSVAKDERSEDEEEDEDVVEEQEKERMRASIPSVELNGEKLVGATGRDATPEGLKRRA